METGVGVEELREEEVCRSARENVTMMFRLAVNARVECAELVEMSGDERSPVRSVPWLFLSFKNLRP